MPTLAEKFSALGDETRLALIEVLLSQGEVSAGTLVESTDISAPAVSRHLKVLRQAGLITQRVEGTHRYYAVAPQALGEINSWTMDHRAFWMAGLDRLENILEEED